MKLDESIEFSMRLLELNPDWVYVYDLQNDKNLYENNKSLEFLGYTKAEFEEMRDSIMVHILHPDDYEKIVDYHNVIRESDQNTFSIEYRVKNKAGEYRTLSSNDSPFKRDKNGKTIQIIGTARDVTRQNKLKDLIEDAPPNQLQASFRRDITRTLKEADQIKRDELRLLQSSLHVIERSRELKRKSDKILADLKKMESPFLPKD